jgi:hypothetical protein
MNGAELFRWKLCFGDPTFIGWLLTGIYLLIGMFALRRSYKLAECSGEWFAMGALMLFFSFNKQLDLQTLISDVGRWIATSLGLMEQRHLFKIFFMLAMVLCIVLTIWYLRKTVLVFFRQFKLTVVGLAGFIIFIILRASSFHLFSDGFNLFLTNVYFFSILELNSLLIILFSTINYYKLAERKILRANVRC